MKKHIFLTGDFQVGKSTLVNRILDQLKMNSYSGFRTITIADIPDTKGSVYIVPANETNPETCDQNRVGIRCGSPGPIAFPEVFDKYGVSILQNAETSKLIIMDEIGKMERNSRSFINRVIELLNGNVPILGVLRKEGETFLQQTIRSHEDVLLIEVTDKNREELVLSLCQQLKRMINRNIDSAGAFVFRNPDGNDLPEVLMISTKRGWSFPKGHVEEGESEKEAAVREVFEETGIMISLINEYCFKTKSALKEEQRNVHYYLAEAKGGTLQPQLSEIQKTEWVTLKEAENRVRFPEDLLAFREAMGCYLALHAVLNHEMQEDEEK